ncbi:MAG: RagB/SusD family nutrient uptake outer membrane protein [Pseudosphingobacterium sp.]|nr:RagB/SusD family nutrient uptake outer membrane protein [Pseudosphingobacterium sp.]
MKYLLFSMIFFWSCKDFVDIDPPSQHIQTKEIFKTDETALSAVNGVYAQMRYANLAFANGAMSVYLGLSADELENPGASSVYAPYQDNALLSETTTLNTTFWTEPYHLIYRTNAIMEGLSESTSVTESAKRQFTGEMLVVRSLCYFYLVNVFGDVPLILSTDYNANAQLPRAPLQEIYERMIADLEAAIPLLSDTYPSGGKLRPNKAVAKALLARIYLYTEKWQQAASLAEELIKLGQFELNRNLSHAFAINSTETIWEIASRNESSNTAEGINFVPHSETVVPAFTLAASLIVDFEDTDKRFQDWLNVNVVNGKIYYYPFKYRNRNFSTPVTEYNVVLRLAEQYLIAAEANSHLEKLSEAMTMLNLIRERAGIRPYDGELSKEACLMAIAIERRKEFFAEWGHRWLDLKRTKSINAILEQRKSSWRPEAALFPIPFNQILTNSNLIQNAGY